MMMMVMHPLQPTAKCREKPPAGPAPLGLLFLETKIFQQILKLTECGPFIGPNSFKFEFGAKFFSIDFKKKMKILEKRRNFFDDEQLKYDERKEIPENIPRFRAATRNGGGTYLLMIYDARRFFLLLEGKDGGFGSLCGSLITFSYRRR
jgi:hypothetical protein